MAGLDANTVYYTRFNEGPDTATTSLDQATGGNAPHTNTFVGTAQLDTAVKKYAGDTSSLLLDENSDYVSVPDSADWDVGTNFTFEAWVRPTSNPAWAYLFGQVNSSEYMPIGIAVNEDDMYMLMSTNGSSWALSPAGLASLPLNTWTHVAYIKVGSDYGLYADGTQVAYGSSGSAPYSSSDAMRIGNAYTDLSKGIPGNIAHTRIQDNNVFSAAPNVGLSNTITIPTEAYSAGSEQSATYTPVPLDLTVPAMTASAVAPLTSSYTAVPLTLTVPTMTATAVVPVTASYTAVLMDLTIPSMTASGTQFVTASFEPVELTLTIPAMSTNRTYTTYDSTSEKLNIYVNGNLHWEMGLMPENKSKYDINLDSNDLLNGGVINYTTLNPAIDLSGYVPYTGATADLELGANNLTLHGDITVGEAAQNIDRDYTVWVTNGYEATQKYMESATQGMGIRYNATANQLIIDRYNASATPTPLMGFNRATALVDVYGALAATGVLTGSNLSGTNTGDQDLSGYVPYTGATSDVNLGVYDLTGERLFATSFEDGVSIGMDADNGFYFGDTGPADWIKIDVNGVQAQQWINNGGVVSSIASGVMTVQGELRATAKIRTDDKIFFTQLDENEFIDSLADGYMDYGATIAHRFNNDVTVTGAFTVTGTEESDVMIYAGDSADVIDDDAEDAGIARLYGGNGGNATDGGDSGEGGGVNIRGGDAGDAINATYRDYAYDGGDVGVLGGNGGDMSIAGVLNIRGGGDGGEVSLSSGFAGTYTQISGDFGGLGGTSGDLFASTAQGGFVYGNSDQTSASTNTGGDSGEFLFYAQSGGGSQSAFNAHNLGGNGGSVTFISGEGGIAQNSLTSNTGGDAGDILFRSGKGGGGVTASGVDGAINFEIGGTSGSSGTLVATFLNDGSGLQQDDNIRFFQGTGEDVSMKFDGSDWIFNSENITADDEIHFTNFTKYTFDNDVEVVDTIDFSANKIIMGDITGNARGDNSIDIQSFRTDATQVSSGARATSLGYRLKTASDSINIGVNNQINDGDSACFGLDNVIDGEENTVIGVGNVTDCDASVIVGFENICNDEENIILGVGCEVDASGGLAVGFQCDCFGDDTVAVGRQCITNASKASSYGINVTNTTAETTEIGNIDTVGNGAKMSIARDGTFTLIGTTPTLKFGADVSMTFDGSDWIFNSENVTANDELKITNFDKFSTDCGRIVNTTRVTTTYTILVTDHTVFCNGTFTATLPAGVEGQSFHITNSGTGIITLDGNGAETINGELTQELYESDSAHLVYNATDKWRIM